MVWVNGMVRLGIITDPEVQIEPYAARQGERVVGVDEAGFRCLEMVRCQQIRDAAETQGVAASISIKGCGVETAVMVSVRTEAKYIYAVPVTLDRNGFVRYYGYA